MAHRTIRRATLTCFAGGAVALLGLTGCGGSSSKTKPPPAAAATPAAATVAATAASAKPTSGSSPVQVTLSEYKITATTPSAPAGQVEFVVTNSGKIKHQFTIIRTTKPASLVLSKQNPDDDIPGARGEIASLAPGASKKLVIKKLKAGHYALVCALPGHYQSGMFADFTVS